MAEGREIRLCPTCGRLAYADDHHPLAAAHAPNVRIAACVPSCHPVLNERQAMSGMVRHHGLERTLPEDVWAFASGLGDILALIARNRPQLGETEARNGERMVAALGRLFDRACRDNGEAGIAGPDPRRNDLRRAGRRGWRIRDRSRPLRPAPKFEPSTELARVRELTRVIAEALATLPQSPGVAELTDLGQSVAANIEDIFEHLRELEARGLADDFYECLAEGTSLRDKAGAALEAVETPRDLERRQAPITRYVRMGDRYLDFVRELIAAPDAEAATSALQRLHADVVAA